MANEKVIKTTNGYFDIVGTIEVDDKVFALDVPGKKNANWRMNTFNPKITGADGQSMYVRINDGYDVVKGKKIFAKSVSDTDLTIEFKDRFTEGIVSKVNEKSFFKVGIGKKTEVNEQGKEYKVWEFKNFLTVYDLVRYLQEVMPLASKHKIRLTGRLKYSVYQEEVQRNYELQKVYILTGNEEEGKELAPGFNFTQNVVVTNGAVDTENFETEGIANINTQVVVRVAKDKYELLPLTMKVRAEEEKRATYKKMIDKFFTVEGDTVRRINIDGYFNSGFIAGAVTEEDLPEEAKELIEDGLYSIEDVLKMYATRERVDETVIKRPVLKKDKDSGKPVVDMSDSEYTMADLKAIGEAVIVTETKIEVSTEDEDFLAELDGI